MDIGGRIRAARKALGMTQEELARRAGMSLKGMGDIERGAIPDPHYSSLNKIAEGLGVSVGELLGGAYRPRYSMPHSKPAETIEEVLGLARPYTIEDLLEALYAPWEEHVNDHVDRWTKKLKDGDFDHGEVKEGWAALKELTRKLSKLNAREKEALPPQPAHYGVPEARTGRAMYRINDLSRLLADAARSKYGEDEPSEQRQNRAEVEVLLGMITG